MESIGLLESAALAVTDGFDALNGLMGMDVPASQPRAHTVPQRVGAVAESVDRVASAVDLTADKVVSQTRRPIYREVAADEDAKFGMLSIFLTDDEKRSGSANTTCVRLNGQYYGLFSEPSKGSCMQAYSVLGPYDSKELLDALRETVITGKIKEIQMPYIEGQCTV